MLRPESWAVIAIAALGIAAAVVAFLRTPRDRRFHVRAPSIEDRLAASPPEARAVIIRADRRRAFRRDLPWLVCAIPLAAFALWFEATQGQPCASLLGFNRVRLAVWSMVTLPPLMVLVACVITAKQMLQSLRGGYWPPLDAPQYVDTLAVAGATVRRQAIASVLVVAAALALLGYGYTQLAFLPMLQRAAGTEAACARIEPSR